MKQGDFTALARSYVNRTGYSARVLGALACYLGAFRDGFTVADVGAGTGKLTEGLRALGLRGHAVEPNDAMRAEGIRLHGADTRIRWSRGTGEATGLPDQSVDWLLMASSFHWTDQKTALSEFRRVLRPGGHFTALWNPRDVEGDPLQDRIERRIAELAPSVQRVSSGSRRFTEGLAKTLLAGGGFRNLLFMEAPHAVTMSRSRYLGAWRSVNDLQAQAGPKRFAAILRAIRKELGEAKEVTVPYLTRAWTVQSTK